jgi:hypothetical protein
MAIELQLLKEVTANINFETVLLRNLLRVLHFNDPLLQPRVICYNHMSTPHPEKPELGEQRCGIVLQVIHGSAWWPLRMRDEVPA